MTRLQRELRRYWPEALLALATLACLMGLIVLGVIWLAERERLLELTVITIALPLLFFLVRHMHAPILARALASMAAESDSSVDRGARKAINSVVETVKPGDIESFDAIQDLVSRVIDGVSAAYHPGDKDARLRFSVPEGLHLLEDVSSRLRATILNDLPALKHVDVRLMLSGSRIYDGYARANNIYRLFRLLNPATALAGEIRKVLLDSALRSLSHEFKIRLAAAVAREVGEVLMRLYNGEYRELAAPSPQRKVPLLERSELEPLRILVAGQPRSGKSCLINALVGYDALSSHASPATEPVAVPCEMPDLGQVHLIETPAQIDDTWEALIRDVDLVIWVAAGNRADRAIDGRALNRIRSVADKVAHLKRTPVVIALTHADRLTPPLEWAPPYDVNAGERLKERNMRASRDAASAALDIPEASTAIVAVRDPVHPWNLEGLHLAICANAASSRQKRLERTTRRSNWKETLVDTVRTVPGGLKRGYKVLKEPE